MAYTITDKCVQCGKCMDECPASAISLIDGKYVIDPDACASCGLCAGVCEVEAPVEE